MAETRKDDQDRFIDETLSLFQNAISETKTALPPVWFGRAVEPKDVPPSEPPAQEKRAASLIGHPLSSVSKVAVSDHKAILVEGVVISEPKAAETASPWLQLPVAEQAREKPVGDAPSLIGHALSLVSNVAISEHKAILVESDA